MSERLTHKKEIAKEARHLFNEGGQSKQQVFELLVGKYKYAKDVADVLKYTPSSLAIKKYGLWNNMLIFLLLLPLALFFFLEPSIPILILYGILIYIVIAKRVRYYVWVSVLSTIKLISLIAFMIMNNSPGQYWIRALLMLIILIPTCYLPVLLEKRLCPKPSERKEEYTNTDGEKRLRIVYEFSE